MLLQDKEPEPASKRPETGGQRPRDENNPADTWISGFYPPELGENEFLLFVPPTVWNFINSSPTWLINSLQKMSKTCNDSSKLGAPGLPCPVFPGRCLVVHKAHLSALWKSRADSPQAPQTVKWASQVTSHRGRPLPRGLKQPELYSRGLSIFFISALKSTMISGKR